MHKFREIHLVRSVTVFLLIGLVGLWEYLVSVDSSRSFYVGSPSLIIQELWQMIWFESFHEHFFITLFEALSGFILGASAGAILGLSFWYFNTVSRILSPILLSIGSIPVLVFAPILIFWFGVGFSLKVALSFIATFFVSFAQAMKGANSVSEKETHILIAMGASRKDLFKLVIVPGSLTWVIGSLRVSVGLALLGAFIGEFIASENGLGYLILRASSLYNMPRALAAALGIVVAAFLLDFLARKIAENRIYLARILSVPAFLR